jgi:hypothetical protein
VISSLDDPCRLLLISLVKQHLSQFRLARDGRVGLWVVHVAGCDLLNEIFQQPDADDEARQPRLCSALHMNHIVCSDDELRNECSAVET